MTIEVRVPQLPESVADATLVMWHKKPGDPVQRDENLVDLETDKVVLEVPAPTAGVVRELKVDNGATVTSGQLLAILEEGAAAAAAPKKETPSPKAAVPAAKVEKLSPSVRRMVEENQLNPAQIAGSGRDGRITKSDVVDYLGQKPAAPATVPAPVAAAAARPAAPGSRAERRVPMTRLRARIAERMVQAQSTSRPCRTCARATRSASRRNTACGSA